MLYEIKQIMIFELDKRKKELKEQVLQLEKELVDDRPNGFQKMINVFNHKEEQRINKIRQNISLIEKEIGDIQEKINNINVAENVKKLGFTFETAIKFLIDNGKKPILRESDKDSSYGRINATGTEDIMLVHKMGRMPNNDYLGVAKERVKNQIEFTVGSISKTIDYRFMRNTLHFCINGEVTSHMDGTWDGKKYYVIVPFNNINKNSFGATASYDTYTIGGVKLDNRCYLLVPEDEIEEATKKNPNTNIIGYEKGTEPEGYARAFLKLFGYSYQYIGNHYASFDDNYDKILQNVGLYNQNSHCDCNEAVYERIDTFCDLYLKVIQFVIENADEFNKNPNNYDEFKNFIINEREAILSLQAGPNGVSMSTMDQYVRNFFKENNIDITGYNLPISNLYNPKYFRMIVDCLFEEAKKQNKFYDIRYDSYCFEPGIENKIEEFIKKHCTYPAYPEIYKECIAEFCQYLSNVRHEKNGIDILTYNDVSVVCRILKGYFLFDENDFYKLFKPVVDDDKARSRT